MVVAYRLVGLFAVAVADAGNTGASSCVANRQGRVGALTVAGAFGCAGTPVTDGFSRVVAVGMVEATDADTLGMLADRLPWRLAVRVTGALDTGIVEAGGLIPWAIVVAHALDASSTEWFAGRLPRGFAVGVGGASDTELELGVTHGSIRLGTIAS